MQRYQKNPSGALKKKKKKMKKWKIVLWIKTINGRKPYETEVMAKTEGGAILAAKQEVIKEYTIIGVKSVERI